MKNRLPVIFVITVWLASFGIMLVKTVPVSGDGIYYYAWLRSIVLDQDVDFLNDLQHFTDNPHVVDQLASGVTTPTGLTPNLFSIGPAIMWAPVWGIAHGVAALSGRFDGFAPIQLLAPSIATSLYGLLGLLLSYGFVRRLLGGRLRHRWLAGLVVVTSYLGTNLVYYTTFEASLVHGLGFFMVALLLYLWQRWRTSDFWPEWLLLGLIIGLAALVRWQLLAVGIVLLGGDVGVLAVRAVRNADWFTLRRHIRRIGFASVGVVLGVIPQLLGWWALYGQPLVIPQGSGFLDWRSPHFFDVLISNRHGLFTWTPLVAVALLVLVVALVVRRAPRHTWLLLLVALVQVYINGAAIEWWGGDAFGARRFTDLSTIWMVGIGALLIWASSRPWRTWLAGALLTLLVLGNVGLLQLYRLDRISRNQPVTVQALIDAVRNE